MDPVPAPSECEKRWLICVAAPREVRSVLDAIGLVDLEIPQPWGIVHAGRFDVLQTGVGKSNAAGATARFLNPDEHCGVLSIGIAGALPGSELAIGQCVVATQSVFADEGIGTDQGWISMADAGFGAFPDGSMQAEHDAGLVDELSVVGDMRGVIATVSWCSGSDGCARGVVERTGAVCECMEGAAVGLAARRVNPQILTAEIRVISNTTGDRALQQWDLDGSLDRLKTVFGRTMTLLG